MSLLLVDGYNVINSVEEYRTLASRNLEEARVKLIEDLIAFLALKGGRIAVVFDGAKANLQTTTEKIEGLEVVFTPSGTSADAVIERMVFVGRGVGEVTVVTADYLSQKVVFGKALRMTPQELVSSIATAKKDAYQTLPERKRLALEERIDHRVRKALRHFAQRESE
jgi:predicted RNA-binding protein with PIN domain